MFSIYSRFNFILVGILFVNITYAESFIREIINNTDYSLQVPIGKEDIIFINTKTGEKQIPYEARIAKGTDYMKMEPWTKIITKIQIPKNNPQSRIISLKFSIHPSSVYAKNIAITDIRITQIGDLFYINTPPKEEQGPQRRKNISISEFIVNGQNINIKPGEQTLGLEVGDNANYSLEFSNVLDQNGKIIPNYVKITLNQIDLNEVNIEPYAQKANAYIKSFNIGDIHNGGILINLLFDQILTNNAFNKFYYLLSNNKSLQNMCTIHKDEKTQSINLKFYTKITQEDFQTKLDSFNALFNQ